METIALACIVGSLYLTLTLFACCAHASEADPTKEHITKDNQ